jgi:hypothetical protein
MVWLVSPPAVDIGRILFWYHIVTLNSAVRNPTRSRWNRQLMYIDPTTGSLVLQFLAAGILSLLAMFARVREAFKSFFRMLVPRRRR